MLENKRDKQTFVVDMSYFCIILNAAASRTRMC
jgi:hypothetical protein